MGGSSLWKVCSGREEKGKGFPWTPSSYWYFLFLTSSWGSIEEGKMSSLSERFHLRFPVSPGVNIDFPQPSQFPAVITEHLAQLQIIKQLNQMLCATRRSWLEIRNHFWLHCAVNYRCLYASVMTYKMYVIYILYTHLCVWGVCPWVAVLFVEAVQTFGLPLASRNKSLRNGSLWRLHVSLVLGLSALFPDPPRFDPPRCKINAVW